MSRISTRFIALALALVATACGEVARNHGDAGAETFTVSVSMTGDGAGTVTSSAGGIACGATCAASFASGAALSLTATPDAGSTFAGWSGGGCTGTGACTVTVSADTVIEAAFARTDQHVLTVVKTGPGLSTGTVTSDVAGIDCGDVCDHPYDPGTVVTLTAAGAINAPFTGWTGAGCSGTDPCVVTLDAATTVSAAFEQCVADTEISPTGAEATFRVPTGCESLRITASGAEGGAGPARVGGRGALMAGTFAVTPGEVLTIRVGMKPATGNGGGGGTYVTRAGVPLVVAGGGGGGAGNCCGTEVDGGPGVIGIDGTAGPAVPCTGAPGGTGGNGGAGGYHLGSGGGGGYLTNGGVGEGSGGTVGQGGQSYASGSGGGAGFTSGGYGGGGGSSNNTYTNGGGGGGGGYSGGGGACASGDWGAGGGGGSYSVGTDQANQTGGHSGHGSVRITLP